MLILLSLLLFVVVVVVVIVVLSVMTEILAVYSRPSRHPPSEKIRVPIYLF